MSTIRNSTRQRHLRTGIWTMALRNIGRRPRRSVLSALAIGIAAVCMVVMLALIAGMKLDTERTIKQNFTADILIQHHDYQRAGAQHANQVIFNLTQVRRDLLADPQAAADIKSLGGRISGGAVCYLDGEAVFFPFIGLEPSFDPLGLGKLLEAGGKLPKPGSRQAIISQALANRLGIKTGDSLTAITQTQHGSSNGITFTISGLLSPAAEQFKGPFMFIDLATAQRFTQLNDGATNLLVQLSEHADPQASLAAIAKRLPADGHLVAQPWDRTSATYGLIVLGEVIYNFVCVFFFILASTVMINTMLMVVLERSREIGTLAALGMDRGVIQRLFLVESAILGGIGAAIGCLVGCVVSLVLGAVGIDFTQAMQGMSLEMASVLRPRLQIQNPLLVFAIAVVVSTAFTYLPVRRIGRMEIVAAIRGD